jgi:hypothetical protein
VTNPLPIEHLSASSVNLFHRCPRQWEDKYVFGNRGPSSSALIIGSTVHTLLNKSFSGETTYVKDNIQTIFDQIVEETDGEIVWRDKPDTALQIAERMFYAYMDRIGSGLPVVATEEEFSIQVPGCPIPVVGYVDIRCKDRVIDVKTTGYLNRNARLNPDWKMQLRIYQLHAPLPAEIHVITRAKKDPVVLPDSKDHRFYVPVVPPQRTLEFLRDTYRLMVKYQEEWGESLWPGHPTHEWASRYCSVENCCQL